MSHPVLFPNWKEVLASSGLSPQQKSVYAREVLTFLKHCKTAHALATVELADIRTVQELLGHASVETAQIYTHVMHPASPRLRRAGKPGFGVRSPLDTAP